MSDRAFGVYVHIPFCAHRCHYCDFNTYEGQESVMPAYVDALAAEIARWPKDGRIATSVFFGGGTPTLLEPSDLGRLLETIRSHIGVAPDAEITVEANPESVDEPRFTALLEAGFNRVSIGVQSLTPKVLLGLGRTHPAERAVGAIEAARRSGFTNVNADLIYGSPWETDADWASTIDGIVGTDPEHISAYALTVEEGTPLATLVGTGRVDDVDPDVQAARHAVADRLLSAAGFVRYEISNWAKPGFECRHNVLYWNAGDYLGFGAGAHAHVNGKRWWSVRLPRDFIARVQEGLTTEEGHEDLATDARAGEALMLGLRLTRGVDIGRFRHRFGAPAWENRRVVVEQLIQRGLLVDRKNRICLSKDATMVANEVLCRVL
ncbi:MAG TPA: radical SAM family heme chaperone HemW [Actinomycetota bacterium]|nr:radical SAM family heme chaperone HemW [Actinomycetota bacterium]